MTLGHARARASVGLRIIDRISAKPGSAYSLRRLTVGYAGSALQVRRSNDNALQDIGFTGGGDLDQSALTTFTGANSGFVSKWYDQSGNARDAVQATAALQPRIVNAGVVDTKNSKPTVVFGASGRTYLVAPTSVTATTLAANAVLYDSATANNGRVLVVTDNTANNDFDSALRAVVMFLSGTSIFGYRNNGPMSSKARTVGQLDVWTSLWDGANHTMYLDQSAATGVASVGTWGSTNLIIGEQSPVGTGTNYWVGGVGEVIQWSATALSSGDRTIVEANQKTYYGTP